MKFNTQSYQPAVSVPNSMEVTSKPISGGMIMKNFKNVITLFAAVFVLSCLVVSDGSAQTAVDDSATVAANGSIEIDVLDNDDTSSPIGYSFKKITIYSHPAFGTALINGNNKKKSATITYTNTASTTTDSFVYRIRFKSITGSTRDRYGTVNITIENQAPVAYNFSFSVAENSSDNNITSLLYENISDANETIIFDSINDIWWQNEENGTVKYSSSNVYFTPDRYFTGTASFQYKVVDSEGAESNWATVNVTVE